MGLGKVGTCARYLGAQLAAPGEYKNELTCRLSAITIGWCRFGSFWITESSYKMKRLCFISNVQSAGLSAGHVKPYLKSQTDQIDSRLCKYLRVAMIGKAHTVETTFAAHPPLAHTYIHRSISNEKVFKFWKIALCSIEFRIRRIRMWQSFLRQPHQHVQVNAAMFGKLVFEADPLDHKGETTTQAHACLRMLEIDINILSDKVPHWGNT